MGWLFGVGLRLVELFLPYMTLSITHLQMAVLWPVDGEHSRWRHLHSNSLVQRGFQTVRTRCLLPSPVTVVGPGRTSVRWWERLLGAEDNGVGALLRTVIFNFQSPY